MIKNEREYRITKAQARKFEQALAEFKQRADETSNLHPLLHKAQEDALRNQLADLDAQLAEYEALRSGRRVVLEVDSFDALPRALIQARIASGLSQRELAERLGLKEQQLQRYEATEYASASLTRVVEVIRALGVKVREEILLPGPQVSLKALVKRLTEIGLDRDFALKRLVPRSAVASAEVDTGVDEGTRSDLTLQAAARMQRIFGWRPADVFGSAPLQLDLAPVGAARFKVAARADEHRLNAYTVYAYYLARLILQATPDLPRKPMPAEASEFRQGVLSSFGSITFEHTLRYVWSLGVPVLPLNDRGAFHGACWRIDGRNVIVLKQSTRFPARWLHDLLHETRHAAEKPEQAELAVIEASETAQERRESPEERAASQFAGDVALGGRAEELVQLCVREARVVEGLKRVVPLVAAAQHVSVDSLANYLAFRLSLEGHNWWGTANNLQVPGPDPWKITRDLLLERIDLGHLSELDRDILVQALSEAEG